MSIPRKNKIQWNGRVMCNGIMAGNCLPEKFEDKAASITRRLMVIFFEFEVKNKRTNLLQLLKTQELAGIIRKANHCYRHAAALVGDQDLWKSGMLSPHIMEENTRLTSSSNALMDFLGSGTVKISLPTPEAPKEFNWCPLKTFLESYHAYLATVNKKAGQWNIDAYSSVFSDAGISVRRADYVWGNDPLKDGDIVVGACIDGEECKMIRVDGEDNPKITDQLTQRVDIFKVTQEQYDSV